MRAVVTGGSGYFGNVMCEALVAQGHEVVNFDLSPVDLPGVLMVTGDIRDRDAIRAACEGADVVFHNVAQVPLARDPQLFESVNSGGTAAMLWAAAHAGVGKVVYTSSSAVFGVPETNPVTEQTPPRPLEAYGRAKLDGELLCAAAVTRGLDVTVVRPRTIVGHGRLGIFAILFDWVADGVDVFVFDGGDNRYQFVHAADLASACLLAGQRPGPATYNIGAQRFGTMRQTLQALCDHAGTGSRVRSLSSKVAAPAMKAVSKSGLAPFADYHWLMYARELWFDTTAAQRDLGWQAQYSNEQMICEAYDWFLTNRGSGLQGPSHHRSAVKQGVLGLGKRVLKRL
ncbi:MAG TPA: NAD-dependent epimerase/dehydratase family protein [Actinomycetota bacterium]|nr:NAD-dependent epimerase/dehydratase family protein [Actinomycetota bacterium]